MGELSKLEVPLRLRRGGRRGDEEWTAAALGLLDLLATSTGRPDLSDASMLDVGCGNKFTAAIVNEDVSIRRYVGVDTDEEVIRFLIEEVDDPRLTFHFLNAHNELYNPAGRPLDSFGRLPVGDERFDIICLFSVFTHLAPHDYRAMLELLRPHVAPEGRLVFSLFVDQGATPEQREAIDADLRRRVEAGDTELMKEIERRVAAGGRPPTSSTGSPRNRCWRPCTQSPTPGSSSRAPGGRPSSCTRRCGRSCSTTSSADPSNGSASQRLCGESSPEACEAPSRR